jgi:hypothetical protein
MAKKKHKPKPRHRNAASPRAPSPPHESSPPRNSRRPYTETSTQRLAYTAAGAAGTAFVGGLLAKQDWKPMTIASVLTAVGTAVAWSGNTPMLQSIGAGAMAASGGQLLLQAMDDRYERALEELSKAKKSPRPRQANTSALPPGALEAAFERARMHTALVDDDYTDDLS